MVRARIQKTFWKVVFLEFSQCFLKRTMQYPFYFKELKKRDFSIFPVFFRVVQSFKREVFFSTLQYLDIVGVLAISNVLKIRIFKKETLYLFHQRYFHKVLNDLDYLFVVKVPPQNQSIYLSVKTYWQSFVVPRNDWILDVSI